MANTNVTKGEKLLYALANNSRCELTPDGANFIKQRFDPYHDTPMKPVGYPDSYNGFTVSRCIKKTMTFTQTSGGAATQTTPWDAHVFMTPVCRPMPLQLTNSRTGNQYKFNAAAALPTHKYGGLMVVGNMASGTNFAYPTVNTPTNGLGLLSLTNDDLKGNMRVTSMGFEVIDGTAALYRQGILTAYRQNQQQKEPVFMEGWADSGNVANKIQSDMATCEWLKFPPVNTADAMAIPNTKQWKVEEGAYVTADFHSDECPMKGPVYTKPIFTQDGNAATISDVDGFWLEIETTVMEHTIPNLATTTFQSRCITPNRILPVNQSGVILTGLNPQATITVNCIWYVECAPTSDDQELLSLCSESPQEDYFAKMIISRLRRDSPVAVKLRENYTGEWFFDGIRSVVNTVTPWLSNALTVGKQVNKWIDHAGKNDGYINPQSFVRGDVATKVAKDHKKVVQVKKGVIPPPPTAPMKYTRAFKPKPVPRVAPSLKKKQKDGKYWNTRKVDNWKQIQDNARRNKNNLRIAQENAKPTPQNQNNFGRRRR